MTNGPRDANHPLVALMIQMEASSSYDLLRLGLQDVMTLNRDQSLVSLAACVAKGILTTRTAQNRDEDPKFVRALFGFISDFIVESRDRLLLAVDSLVRDLEIDEDDGIPLTMNVDPQAHIGQILLDVRYFVRLVKSLVHLPRHKRLVRELHRAVKITEGAIIEYDRRQSYEELAIVLASGSLPRLTADLEPHEKPTDRLDRTVADMHVHMHRIENLKKALHALRSGTLPVIVWSIKTKLYNEIDAQLVLAVESVWNGSILDDYYPDVKTMKKIKSLLFHTAFETMRQSRTVTADPHYISLMAMRGAKLLIRLDFDSHKPITRLLKPIFHFLRTKVSPA